MLSIRNGSGAETPSLTRHLGTTVPINALMNGMVNQTTISCTTVITASMTNAMSALTTLMPTLRSTNTTGMRLCTALRPTLISQPGPGTVPLAPWIMSKDQLTTTALIANVKRLVIIRSTAITVGTVLRARQLPTLPLTKSLPIAM